MRIKILGLFFLYLSSNMALCQSEGVGQHSLSLQNESFDQSANSLYTKTREQLQQTPSVELQAEINRLETRNEAEKNDLAQIRAYNQAICRRIEQLERDCPAQHYIANDYGLVGLDCDHNNTEFTDRTSILITVSKASGKYFRLIANGEWFTQPFSSGGHKVVFTRQDNQLIKPPKFRDIKSLVIQTIEKPKQGQVSSHYIQDKRPSDLEISITVNGKPLLDSFGLESTENDAFQSTYRINPIGILDLGSGPGCQVSPEELSQLQRTIQNQ